MTIDRLGAAGDGIARWRDRDLYIPRTLPGETVAARVEQMTTDQARGRLLELLAPSPDRVDPLCRHFVRCGGCQLQHLAPGPYAAFKRGRIERAMGRSEIPDAILAPTAASPLASRRRATFAAKRTGNSVVLGFNEAASHTIVDLAECPVLDPALVALLPRLRELAAAILAPGDALDIAALALPTGIDLALTGPAELSLDAREHLAALADSADIARISWRGHEKAGFEPVAARKSPDLMLAGLRVAVPPAGFLQATAAGEAALIDAILHELGTLPAGAKVADLFAGLGTFALPLAKAGFHVHAADLDGPALAALDRTARLAGWHGARITTERRDLFAQPLSPEELEPFAAVVFDPPRAGARSQADALARSTVPLIAAVSCNPETFARDARLLGEGGYRATLVLPVDQFVYSAHVELIAIFRRL